MKPAPFDYVRPATLEEAVAALAADPGAKVLAGGQSLVPLLSMRLAAPTTLVDLNRVPGLDTIKADASGVRVGALVRHAAVLASADVRRVQPLVTMALAHVAHPTIRNRGTTVGSIVHADAAGEMPVVLALLGGSVDVVGTSGRRTIAAGDLVLGPLETSLAHDEVAVSAWFPALAPGAGVAFDEVARRHGDYAMCGAAAMVSTGSTSEGTGSTSEGTGSTSEGAGSRGEEVRVGFLSVNDVPTVVDLTGVADADLGEAALAHLDPVADVHASAAYRAQLVRVVTRRVVEAARADAHQRTGAVA